MFKWSGSTGGGGLVRGGGGNGDAKTIISLNTSFVDIITEIYFRNYRFSVP